MGFLGRLSGKIIYYWRLLRKRCIFCGKKRQAHPNCFHCWKHTCHNCGKIWNFASNYGMGKKDLLKVLNA